jgi:hypothetical protein
MILSPVTFKIEKLFELIENPAQPPATLIQHVRRSSFGNRLFQTSPRLRECVVDVRNSFPGRSVDLRETRDDAVHLDFRSNHGRLTFKHGAKFPSCRAKREPFRLTLERIFA